MAWKKYCSILRVIEQKDKLFMLNKRRDLRYRADLQLVGHVCRPFIIDVNWYRICGSVHISVDLYEVA